MVVLNFNIVNVVIVLLQYGNETTAQENNVQNNTVSCSDKQYEVRVIPRSNSNISEYFGNKKKGNGSSRSKRQAIIPNILGLGTELLSLPRTNAQLNPGVSAQMSPGINSPLTPGINAPLNPRINDQLSPGANSPLSPGIKAPLSPGINSPLISGIIAQLNPGINVPLNPGIIAQLSQGINAPLNPKSNDQMCLGTKAQLSPGIDKEIPNFKEQSSVSGTTNSVKYPVQVFIIYPKDIDKNLNDIKTEQTTFTVDNRNFSKIINALNPDNLENNQIVNSTATNIPNMTAINSADKSHPIVNNTPQIATNINSNVTDPNHIESLSINKTNKTDISLTDHKDDDVLKNDTHCSINNVAENLLLHNSTTSENSDSENSTVPLIFSLDSDNVIDNLEKNDSSEPLTSSDYDKNYDTSNENICFPDETEKNQPESRPIPSVADGKKKIQLNKFVITPIHNPIKYILMEKVKPDIQNTNSTTHEKFDHEVKNSEADGDEKSIGLLYSKNGNNNISNNVTKVKYPCSNFQYFYREPITENCGAYNNYLSHIYNDYRNAFVQRYGNMRPAFKYPCEDQNMLTYQYQLSEGTPKSIGQMRDSNFLYNDKGNEGTQEYSNILPVFKYPVELWKRQESQTIPENYNLYNGNDLNNGYNQKGNYVLQDYRNIPSEFKYPLNTNNIQLSMAYKNWYNANQKYANIRPAFQYPNVNQYVRPENVAEIHSIENNFNEIRGPDINRNNDPAIISRNFESCYNNNNGFGMVHLNTGINAQANQIPCRCNQQSSVITCNGFYKNQSVPITYPTYIYYPYVYRNIPR